MARYLLDTDICSYIMKRSHPVLLERIRSVPIADQAMSAVTAAELLYGVKLSAKQKQAREAFNAFVRHLEVLEWPAEAAEHYADIRADLRHRGEMIGANDLLIAAHARSLKAVLVTNNVREFGRVKGLKVENWTA
ncbi:MAG: VapC toxin family PIN domain ribonuclease [Rhodocyclales bacterium]|jgi:tRNA(fMet)-specific endonuclease VapC|nr:MAG: VapC toxin family PIN domain ribonuclease [Rhodocyclales bacterium]